MDTGPDVAGSTRHALVCNVEISRSGMELSQHGKSSAGKLVNSSTICSIYQLEKRTFEVSTQTFVACSVLVQRPDF
eukprot:757597-Hanusia_phi.AAC.2